MASGIKERIDRVQTRLERFRRESAEDVKGIQADLEAGRLAAAPEVGEQLIAAWNTAAEAVPVALAALGKLE